MPQVASFHPIGSPVEGLAWFEPVLDEAAASVAPTASSEPAATRKGERMLGFDENTITEAVLTHVAGTADPRTRQVSEALVRHLHAFVKEIEPTQAEWEAGIGFLTRVGQMCGPTRQEFILLSDTLGVSMLVDAINHRLPGPATDTTVLGPFYTDDAPVYSNGDALDVGVAGGTPLRVACRILDAEGQPIVGAKVDTWHSDADGYYDIQKGGEVASLRARFIADSEGGIDFTSIVPAFYPVPDDGPVGRMLAAQGRHAYRPAHIHFLIAASGYQTLVTHLFLAGDPYLDSDVVFGVKDSLICALADDPQQPGRQFLTYDFVLAPGD